LELLRNKIEQQDIKCDDSIKQIKQTYQENIKIIELEHNLQLESLRNHTTYIIRNNQNECEEVIQSIRIKSKEREKLILQEAGVRIAENSESNAVSLFTLKRKYIKEKHIMKEKILLLEEKGHICSKDIEQIIIEKNIIQNHFQRESQIIQQNLARLMKERKKFDIQYNNQCYVNTQIIYKDIKFIWTSLIKYLKKVTKYVCSYSKYLHYRVTKIIDIMKQNMDDRILRIEKSGEKIEISTPLSIVCIFVEHLALIFYLILIAGFVYFFFNTIMNIHYSLGRH